MRIRLNKSGETFYEGSSPDEIALGDFAKEMFFELIERDEKNLKIRDYLGKFKINQYFIIFIIIDYPLIKKLT